ncbi:MAG: histidine utilization repressor [Thermodesulfobacteriota bacterium]
MPPDFADKFKEMNEPGLPIYRRIKKLVREQIASGALGPGEQLPSEAELVRQLGASRMTVNRALRELTGEGYLFRIMGVGTFVARTKPQMPLFEIRSIAEEIRLAGGEYDARVHLLREEAAAEDLALEMEMRAGDPVFRSVVVHRDRGTPIQLEDRYVRPDFAPDYLEQDFRRIAPADFLMRIAPTTEVEHILEAIMPLRSTRKLLAIGSDEPCLILHRRTWVGPTVTTATRFAHPGSRYRIGGRFRPMAPDGSPGDKSPG